VNWILRGWKNVEYNGSIKKEMRRLLYLTSGNDRNTKLVPAISTQCGGQIEVNPTQESSM